MVETAVSNKMNDRIKLAVRALYDAQKLRIQLELRIQRLIRDAVMSESEAKYFFELPFSHFEKAEKILEKTVWLEIRDLPIVKLWLSEVKGIGPRLSGLIVANIDDIGRFDTISKLWAYCGLHVKDGAAAKRQKGEQANWNRELKTTLWKAATSFVKCGGPYRKLYDQYKARIIERTINSGEIVWSGEAGKKKYTAVHVPAGKEVAQPKSAPNWTLGRINNMALRYIAKRLLAHIWLVWRKMEDLPTREPYCVEYQGHNKDSIDDPWDYVNKPGVQ